MAPTVLSEGEVTVPATLQRSSTNAGDPEETFASAAATAVSYAAAALENASIGEGNTPGAQAFEDVFLDTGESDAAAKTTMQERLKRVSSTSFEDINLEIGHIAQPRADSGPALTLDGVDPSAYDSSGVRTVSTCAYVQCVPQPAGSQCMGAAACLRAPPLTPTQHNMHRR